MASALEIKKVCCIIIYSLHFYFSVSQISIDIVVHVIVGALNLLAIKRLFGTQRQSPSIRNGNN